MNLPKSRITLSRVLVLTLGPSLAAVAISVYNSVQITHDREHRTAIIDAEICTVVARIPGPTIPALERFLRCPVTRVIPLPTPTTVTTTVMVPHTSGRGVPSRSTPGVQPSVVEATASPRPVIVAKPTPRPTSRPAPKPGVCPPLLHQLDLC